MTTITRALQGLVLCAVMGLALLATPASAEDSAIRRLGLERTGPGTFSIDVEGADVRTVCRAVSEFSGKNIVVANGVKAEITIRLSNVGWQDALRTMMRSAGLDYVEEGGIIRVDQSGKLREEITEREQALSKQQEVMPLETRIIKLSYANAPELTSSLQSAVSRRGSVLTEKRTNSLIVTDLPSNLDRIEQMAKDLDSTTPQIEITAKLVDVDAEALRGIGIEWNVGRESEFGLTDGSGDPLVGPGFQPNNDPQQFLGPSQDTGIPNAAHTITYGIIKDWGFIEAQLQLLEQNRKANIISNPRITTVDNREAKILVGQKIPLIVQDISGNPVSQLQTIGIQLKVTPHLTTDKKVVMDLHPEVSDLSTQSTVQGGVIINTSEADTRVMVDDGQTAVIGGLIRTNESEVRRGVPILKDMPLIGFLFRSTNTIHQNRELIIFVTPRIVTSMANNE
jgi:type IV pilus assembly protein PilQ